MNLLEQIKAVCDEHVISETGLCKSNCPFLESDESFDCQFYNFSPFDWNTDEIVRILESIKEGK